MVGQLCSLFGGVSSLVVITWEVRSLEVLVDVGEGRGAQVVVGHGLRGAFIQSVGGNWEW